MLPRRSFCVFATVVCASVVRAQQPAPAGPVLRGIVRAEDSALPLSSALVQLRDLSRHAWTDTTGAYTLDVPVGAHHILVSRLGYTPRELVVVAGSDSVIRVDVALTVRPLLLTRQLVQAAEPRVWTRSAAPGVAADSLAGRRLWPLADAVPGEADVLAAASITPDGTGAGPERGAALYVRGGSSDHNLVLLDGVPLYFPYHMLGAMSAVNPDVVFDARLHAGAPSARFGGTLSSMVDIRTRDADTARWATRGAFGAGLARLTVAGPIAGSGASFVVSGRRGARAIPGFANGVSPTDVGVGDLFGKASLPMPGGTVELLGFVTADHLAFAATVDPAFDTASGPATQGTSPRAAGPSGALNRFVRSGQTLAMIWRSDTAARLRTEARLWRSGGAGSGDMLAPSGPVHLFNELSSVGGSVDVAWRLASGQVLGGLLVERLRSRYDVTRVVSDSTGTILPLSLSADRTLVAPFVEAFWRLTPRWAVTLGVRDQVAIAGLGGIEPRLAVRFRATRWLSLATSAGRFHQPVQTLSNGESGFETFLGGALPVVTEGPMARSDRVTLGATLLLGRHATVSLDAFVNRLDRLALVAPSTAQPFAIERVARGSGRARGVLLGLDYQHAGLIAHAAYALTDVVRTADGYRYTPATADPHAFSAALAYQFGQHTRVRAAVWGAATRQSTLYDGALDWSNATGAAGDELAGSPQPWVDGPGAAPLPTYLRVDLGVQQTWEIGIGARLLRVTGAVNVINALDRANVRGYAVPSGGSAPDRIPMLPRLITLGLEFAF